VCERKSYQFFSHVDYIFALRHYECRPIGRFIGKPHSRPNQRASNPKIALPMGDLESRPQSNTLPRPDTITHACTSTNGSSIASQVFILQQRHKFTMTIPWAAPCPPQNCPFPCCDLHPIYPTLHTLGSIRSTIGPIRHTTRHPHPVSRFSTVQQTDIQTDRQTYTKSAGYTTH